MAAGGGSLCADRGQCRGRCVMEPGEIRAAMVEVMNIMLDKGRDAIERMAEAVERLQALIDQIDAAPRPEPQE